jgi:hypothetical protein
MLKQAKVAVTFVLVALSLMMESIRDAGGGKGMTRMVVHFQMRPDPLAH